MTVKAAEGSVVGGLISPLIVRFMVCEFIRAVEEFRLVRMTEFADMVQVGVEDRLVPTATAQLGDVQPCFMVLGKSILIRPELSNPSDIVTRKV